MSLRKDMATAKAAAAKASVPKRKPAVRRKLKKEESSSSSSSDSNFSDDEDFDSIQIPGVGKNVQSGKTAGSASSKPSLPSLDEGVPAVALKPVQTGTSILRPPLQPGYEVIRIQPGMNPFGALRGPMASLLQQAVPGTTVRINAPAALVQAMLANQSQLIRGSLAANRLYQLQAQAPQVGGMDYVPGLGLIRAQQPAVTMDENMEEEENMGVAETYSDYMPSKLKVGRKHPDAVVETASMASVSPPDVWYRLAIPEETIKSGLLSALQLEAITYASQQHEQLLPDGTRAGFLIGDGPGVGKGRTVAGVIFENYLRGRKRAIWVSVSSDLKYDAERDLRDIGAGKVSVHALNKMKYAKISSDVNGAVKKGVIFSTYSSLIGESQSSGGKYKTRLKQLLQWCGEDFDGVIVFDECHRAKNLVPTGSTKPTKTGLTVLELQNKLPKARVIYASATGASEPKNMAYMVRLGLWGAGTPFPAFNEFISAVEKRGVGSMEIVAMEMKLRGMYIARQLSFKDVSFKIEEVNLAREFVKIYDDSVRFWVGLLQSFTEAIELMDLESRLRKTVWGQFWSAHQRFFKYLCIAAKVKHAVRVASEAVKCGKCVVIGLQSTGEARTLEQLENEGELTDFVSTAKGVLQTLVEKHFPAPDRNRTARILELDGRKTVLDELGIDLDMYRGTKRKAVKEAAERATKKATVENDSDEESRHASDSDFEVSDDSDSGGSSSFDMGSDADSDDHNPFGDSDNEDPWCRSRKNGKNKAAKKKPKAKPVKKEEKKKEEVEDDDIQVIETVPKPAVRQQPSHQAVVDTVCKIKERLLAEIEQLGATLPPNTLDQLIDDLGGPENVAEMTGRKGRVVQNDDGQVQYESRSENDVPLEILNVREKERFMNAEKDVAIISEAASSGISLHADRRVKNQRRRVHITLELPWSADRAIQQFGRTHRSNQVSSPEYIFLISDLAGERRFASIVAKRLESLGALTHGDRRATESRDLSQFNFDTKYGRAALDATMKAIMGYEAPVVPPPVDYKGDFFKDVAGALVGVGLICNSETNPGVVTLDKDYNNMSKFLNRILGMPVDLQNRLFKYFTDTLAAIVEQAKKSGRYDLGILDLGAGSQSVRRLGLHTFTRKHPTGLAKTELHVIEVERGMNWETAKEKWTDLTGQHEGFYLSQQSRNGKYTACLVVSSSSGLRRHGGERSDPLFSIYRPNTGLQVRQEPLSDIKQKYRKVTPDEAEPIWNDQFHASKNTCYHAYWNGRCSTTATGQQCQMGLRQRTYNVLSGSVLSVWSKVENVLNSAHVGNRMQVVRLRGADLKLVGTLVPPSCLQTIIALLSEEAENVTHETF